jgi:branched-chain amino acid transport system substrate-binding protein
LIAARAATPTRAAIKSALAETKDFDGATGTMSVDADHNPRKAVIVVRVANKRFTYEKRVETDGGD